MDVKQKQLATATKCAEEWKAEYLKKSEEVDVKQKQLATATKCAEEWKAEYLKKSEEVDVSFVIFITSSLTCILLGPLSDGKAVAG